jgi:hypothetical protein
VIVVLAHGDDLGAAAVARTIAARRGPKAVCHVTAAALAAPRHWTHTVGADGAAGGALVLASGQRLVADDIGSVLNRLRTLVPPAFSRAHAREQDYAAAELQALAVSWLAGLGRPVVHVPGGVGPLPARSRRQWLMAGRRAGLPVVREVEATRPRLREVLPENGARATVLLAGERAYGTTDPALADRCAALGRATGGALLELRFATLAGAPRLADVDPFPPLLEDASIGAAADLLERLAA